MIELHDLIKPTWSTEKSLYQAWSILTPQEKFSIKERMDAVFHTEIPFALEHDKLAYIHLFSLLAELETIGLKGLIKSLNKLQNSALYPQLRRQITDEIFHATLFAKIACQLSAPYALPIGHEKNIQHFISSLEKEEDLVTSLTLTNLVGESWLEEVCLAMKEKNIAKHIFEIVLEDESRHLTEYDLYQQLGLPDSNYLKKKVALVEDELINTVFANEQYIIMLEMFLGREDAIKLLSNINDKQHRMLKKIGLSPSKNWQSFMKTVLLLMQGVSHDYEKDTPIAQTNMRKVLSSLWSDPELPTESTVFGINVTPVDFFEKKYRPETITCLMLQALSKGCFDNPQTRNYVHNHKLYHARDCYVALAVQIPGTDQIGAIEFKNCHDMALPELAQHIQNDLSIMIYCYKKTQALQKEYPYLKQVIHRMLPPRHERVYRDFLFARPAISLSNVGHWGYQTVISPLFPNETVKLTLAEIEKKQVWNKKTKQFEVQDILPVGLSVDHRIFDGNIPIPRYLQEAFDSMFFAMQQATPKALSTPFSNLEAFIADSEALLQDNVEFGFLCLFSLTYVFKNYFSYEELKQTVAGKYRNLKSLLAKKVDQCV